MAGLTGITRIRQRRTCKKPGACPGLNGGYFKSCISQPWELWYGSILSSCRIFVVLVSTECLIMGKEGLLRASLTLVCHFRIHGDVSIVLVTTFAVSYGLLTWREMMRQMLKPGTLLLTIIVSIFFSIIPYRTPIYYNSFHFLFHSPQYSHISLRGIQLAAIPFHKTEVPPQMFLYFSPARQRKSK